MFGSAAVCIREARLIASPIAVYSDFKSLPMLPTTTSPVFKPMRTPKSRSFSDRSFSRYSVDTGENRERGQHSALRVVFVRNRRAEEGQDCVAH